MTLAPLAAGGKILVGVSGGEYGIRGFVAALDAETGKEAWRTYTIPGPGKPGNDTWPGDTWKTGAASVWMTGTYDPDLKMAFYGTGNAGPWNVQRVVKTANSKLTLLKPNPMFIKMYLRALIKKQGVLPIMMKLRLAQVKSHFTVHHSGMEKTGR